jgi:glutathione synthase/RimK-type ligase-like ATP-grasp enzyme
VILILSNARDATADFLQKKMTDLGISFLRLNTELLPKIQLTAAPTEGQLTGGFTIDQRYIRFDDVNAVYYRRPTMPVIDGEMSPGLRAWIQSEYRRTWGGLLLALTRLRWVNHPLAISGASYKPEQLIRAQRFGLSVPATLITTQPEEARAFCARFDWSVIAKPLGHGEISGTDDGDDQLVYTSALSPDLENNLSAVTHCPTLFQYRVPKNIDIRVTVIDHKCIAVALHSQEQPISQIDCRRNNMAGMRYSHCDLPPSLADSLIRLTRSYNLYFSAIDLARDTSGQYWFFELNPAGQWAWLEQKIGVPLSAALINCLQGEAA